MISKKVKAFTIMELIVSLTISSLVIFSCVEFLSGWERLLSRRNSSLEHSGGVLKFYDVLNTDIKDSEKVLSDDDRIRIMSVNKEVSYDFEETRIIRTLQETRDTFNFSKVTFSMKKDLVTEYVRVLGVEIATGNDSYSINIEKIYSGAQQINSLVFK